MTIGTKKSDFTGKAAIPGSATFDYVYNGFNTKVTFDNLAVALGASGTIRQVGASSDFPVLDSQGLTSGIRNLKEGAGISIQISPQNSLEISTSATFDQVGIPLVDSATASPLNYRSLVAGSSMLITSPATGQISISLDKSDIVEDNRILVKNGSMLIGALDSTKEYFLDGVIDMTGAGVY